MPFFAQGNTSDITTAASKLLDKEILGQKVEVQLLIGKNIVLEDQAIANEQKRNDLEGRIKTEEAARKRAEEKAQPRKFDASDLPSSLKKFRGHVITLVRLEEPEANDFAKKIRFAFAKTLLTPRYEQIPATTLEGVWVCLNSQTDRDIAEALEEAVDVKRFGPKTKDRPESCDREIGPNAPVFSGERGTVIIVGHKPR